MPLTDEEREATLKPEEFENLPKMKSRVVYTSYYPAWVLSVLKKLKESHPDKEFRLRYQIVEIEQETSEE